MLLLYYLKNSSKNVLILDNATWHRRKTLRWHGWQPMYLPPYSPDLNPIERIWLVMKANWFNHYVCKDVDQLIDRLDKAILESATTSITGGMRKAPERGHE